MSTVPSRIVCDGAPGTTDMITLNIGELSGQHILTGVTATMSDIVKEGVGVSLVVLSDPVQVAGDIELGQQAALSWEIEYPAETDLGKYTGEIMISSNETADLVLPVVGIVRECTETVSMFEGPDEGTAVLQKSLDVGPDGAEETWVNVPEGHRVVYAALCVAAGSQDLIDPALDVGADDVDEWSYSGTFDLGLLLGDLESPFNDYLDSTPSGPEGWNVPIEATAPADKTVLLNGVQLYLESAPEILPAAPPVCAGDYLHLTTTWGSYASWSLEADPSGAALVDPVKLSSPYIGIYHAGATGGVTDQVMASLGDCICREDITVASEARPPGVVGPPTCMDVNGAGVHIDDVIRMLRRVVGLDSFAAEQEAAGDFNLTGVVDLSDVINCLRVVVGLDPVL